MPNLFLIITQFEFISKAQVRIETCQVPIANLQMGRHAEETVGNTPARSALDLDRGNRDDLEAGQQTGIVCRAR